MTSPQYHSTIRSLYRRFLRELPVGSNSSLLSKPSLLQQQIRAQLTPTNTTASSNDAITTKLQEAEQFAQYLTAQRMYLTLVERYNPGMGMDETERVRLTARRVGMNLPPEFKKKE